MNKEPAADQRPPGVAAPPPISRWHGFLCRTPLYFTGEAVWYRLRCVLPLAGPDGRLILIVALVSAVVLLSGPAPADVDCA